MYHTLEVGQAGTNEWLAASKNMTPVDSSYAGLVSYSEEANVGVFISQDFEADLRKVSRKKAASAPVEGSK